MPGSVTCRPDDYMPSARRERHPSAERATLPGMLAAYARYRHLRTRLVNTAIRRDFASWGIGVQLHVPFRVEGAERIRLFTHGATIMPPDGQP